MYKVNCHISFRQKVYGINSWMKSCHGRYLKVVNRHSTTLGHPYYLKPDNKTPVFVKFFCRFRKKTAFYYPGKIDSLLGV